MTSRTSPRMYSRQLSPRVSSRSPLTPPVDYKYNREDDEPSYYDIFKNGGRTYTYSEKDGVADRFFSMYDRSALLRYGIMGLTVFCLVISVLSAYTYSDKRTGEELEKEGTDWSRLVLFYRTKGGQTLMAFSFLFLLLLLLLTGFSLQKIKSVLTAQRV